MMLATSAVADWGSGYLLFLDSSVALISLGANPGKTATIVHIGRGKASIARNTILVVNWRRRKKTLLLTKLTLTGFFQ